ncbi:MAG TPA: FHA domain-containing protein, partial [Chthoniobacteraceae bacterium]|nr:FHA domain-containing protein [Chthoniobacteraceae bacterium]
MPKLQISLPDGTQNSFDLIEDTITVGRVEDNMIQIDDASVSSHHAELVRDGDDYLLRDLDSTNGTRLNG